SIERSSGNLPTCQFPVPAESTLKFSGSLVFIIPSAKGDLQILPKQTIKIFISKVLFRTNFSIQILYITSENLIGFRQILNCFTCVKNSCVVTFSYLRTKDRKSTRLNSSHVK